MTHKRLPKAVILVGLGLNLASCGGFIADHWPHEAGGVPEVVPPRPSAPGYAEFIAHGQPKPETPNETRAAQPPPATSAAQARMPQDNLSQDSNVVNGGLY